MTRPIKALVLGCTLKPSPETSNTEELARVVERELQEKGAETELVRVVDYDVHPGVSNDEGAGDEWPSIRKQVLAADILVIATPTWLGQQSSMAKRVLERLDAMIFETDDAGHPPAYNKVAGIVVTGTSDGAHWVVAEVEAALIEIGFTVPGQSWTYWNIGPGGGQNYTETEQGHDWSESTGKTAAANLYAVAEALRANPIPAPPK